jgi:hypothetical protein
MANQTTANPWRLDTPATITTDRVRVAKLRWVAEGASAGDNVVVSDSAGRVFWEAVASGANQTSESDQFHGRAGDVEGFVLTTIQAGHLYVHYA